jgi:hypothetical protein
MAVVGKKTLEKWIKTFNKEYGLSHKNKECLDYFMKIREIANFDIYDDSILVTLVFGDAWGEKILSVVTYYILPEYRNYKNFIKIQNRIDELAKINNVRYIYQGSHLAPKLNGVLMKRGYQVGVMKKEII